MEEKENIKKRNHAKEKRNKRKKRKKQEENEKNIIKNTEKKALQ